MSDLRAPECRSSQAQTLAGRAVLLEIGARLGLLDPLLAGKSVTVAGSARVADVPESFVAGYYVALERAGLARAAPDGTTFTGAPGLGPAINDAGYVLWAVMSCAPLVANARAFTEDLPAAMAAYPRDGEHVGRTSKWMGEADFYPHAEGAILAARPNRIVDLGSGTCGLLIRCLSKLPGARGVGIDVNPAACATARANIAAAGLADRVAVVEAPIQSLVQNPAPLEGAEAVHAGFVFHDLVPEESDTLDALLRTIRRVAPVATLVVVDAIPAAAPAHEAAFSSAFTFLHSHFMGRQLMPEADVRGRLARAGFATVEVEPLGISGGRKYTARPAA